MYFTCSWHFLYMSWHKLHCIYIFWHVLYIYFTFVHMFICILYICLLFLYIILQRLHWALTDQIPWTHTMFPYSSSLGFEDFKFGWGGRKRCREIQNSILAIWIPLRHKDKSGIGTFVLIWTYAFCPKIKSSHFVI